MSRRRESSTRPSANPAVNRAGYSIEEVRAGIDRALELCDPGQRLTARRYRVLSQTHGLPPLSVIGRATSELGSDFSTLVQEQATVRVRASAAPPA